MNIKASRTYIHMSPRKLREVADMIRGKDARASLASLQFVRRRAAEPIGLVLRQAIANASQVGAGEKLIISKLLIDEGPVSKRFRAISRGQAHPIQKYSAHIKIELSPVVISGKNVKKQDSQKNQLEVKSSAEATEVKKEVKEKTVKKTTAKSQS